MSGHGDDHHANRGRGTGHDRKECESSRRPSVESLGLKVIRASRMLAWVDPGSLMERKRSIEHFLTEFVLFARHEREASQGFRRSVVGALRYALTVTNRRFFDDGDTMIELTSEVLKVGELYDWSVLPRCGAVVVFSGTVRDHSEGRDNVQTLTYEAYDEQVIPKCLEITIEIRRRWPSVGRVALVHRVGELALGESSVLVVVSAPHRPEAFDAARFGIDALKATVPIWKREQWGDGGDWANGAQHITDVKTLNDASAS